MVTTQRTTRVRKGPSYPAFAGLIRARRKQLGLSQAFVAERVGVDQSTLARWENGNRIPSGPTLLRLQNYLRFTDTELEAAFQKPA